MPGLYRVPKSRFPRITLQGFRDQHGKRKQIRISYRPGENAERAAWMKECASAHERDASQQTWFTEASKEQRKHKLESIEETDACAVAWATHLEECRRQLEGEESAVTELYSHQPFSQRIISAWTRSVDDLKSERILSEAQARELLNRGPAGSEEVTVRADGADMLGPAVESFLDSSKHLSPKTLANYRHYLAFVREKCGDSMSVESVYKPDTLLWIGTQQLEKAKACAWNETGGASRRLLKQSLSSLANHLKSRGMLSENRVGEIIPSVKESHKERKLFTEKQLASLLESAKRRTVEARERGQALTDWSIVIRILMATGVRKQGLVRMQWKHFRLSPAGEATVTIIPGKSRRHVTAPLDRDLVRDIRLWRLSLPKEFRAPEVHLVSAGTKRPRPNAQPNKQLEHVFTGAGMEFTGYHVFRHTAAIRWLDMGLDIEDVQNLLGHSELQTTMVYLKWWKSLKRREVLREKLAGVSQPVSHRAKSKT